MHGQRPTISSLEGVVAAAHPHAAAAGALILQTGGNAFDAAVAVAAALNVVEPYMSSLAGAGLAACWVAKENRVRTLNFTPAVPKNFPLERYSKREDLQRGAQAAGVPGNLAGWSELQRTYGKLDFKAAFAPAIKLARGGYPVTEFNIEETNLTAPELLALPGGLASAWAKNYTDGTGRIAPGFILRQSDLANTLEALAAHGAAHLYGGALGKALVAHVQAGGGAMTMADLEAVQPVWADAATASYRGALIHTPPPPCEGFQMLVALRLLDGIDIGKLPRLGLEQLDLVWRAIRLAAGVRIAHIHPTPQKLAELLADPAIAILRKRLQDGTPVDGPTEQWTPPVKSGDQHTTSFSIADGEGNLVCITQSIGSPFGAAVIVPGTGLMLNNFLFWADVQPNSPNRIKPGAALPICMSPTITTRGGKPILALGTPGSYGIMQTQVQALVQHFDYGLPPQAAIEAPRARLLDGRRVVIEPRLDETIVSELIGRGHAVERAAQWTMLVGGMQAVAVDPRTGAKTAGADPRRDGYAIAV
jgi:gamma-glutamyltranspeptidase / glutathione hydrolase